MNNRNNKPKKTSKHKQTILCERQGYASPSRFSTVTKLSSGCHPKNPPNISRHYLQKNLQKKQQQVKVEYYAVSGKENKSRIMNNGSQNKQKLAIMQTAESYKQKRGIHQLITYENRPHKLAQMQKTSHFRIPYNEVNNMKTLNRSKHNDRDPIQLKPEKAKLMRNRQNQNVGGRQQRQLKKQFKPKSNLIAQKESYYLMCFETLSRQSIAQSKVSSNCFGDSTNLNLEESHLTVEKQPSLKARKGLHRSPKVMSPSPTPKLPQKTPEQEIAEFQAQINQININFEHDSLHYIKTKDETFIRSKNLNRYLDNQLHLDFKKRAMVINWMIEVLAQTGGKRQTLANAVNIFDRYLSMTLNIPLDHVQCTAVSCLLIAAKLEDKSLSASYLSEATLNKYSPQEIMQQEYKIFKKLNFQVNTPTLNSWVNRLAVQWDLYLDNVDLRGFDIIHNNLHLLKFKNSDQTSYYNFRWLCQYIDFSIIDIFTLRYQPRMLSLAFIYLILIMRLNLYTKDKVISVFPNSSQFLLEKSLFNEFYSKFLKDSFDQELNELLPMIQYCATFVILPLKFDLPDAVPENAENENEQVNYEFFCSYQTKNQHTLASLFNRNRNVY